MKMLDRFQISRTKQVAISVMLFTHTSAYIWPPGPWYYLPWLRAPLSSCELSTVVTGQGMPRDNHAQKRKTLSLNAQNFEYVVRVHI